MRKTNTFLFFAPFFSTFFLRFSYQMGHSFIVKKRYYKNVIAHLWREREAKGGFTKNTLLFSRTFTKINTPYIKKTGLPVPPLFVFEKKEAFKDETFFNELIKHYFCHTLRRCKISQNEKSKIWKVIYNIMLFQRIFQNMRAQISLYMFPFFGIKRSTKFEMKIFDQ